jgi:hypothetical protein
LLRRANIKSDISRWSIVIGSESGRGSASHRYIAKRAKNRTEKWRLGAEFWKLFWVRRLIGERWMKDEEKGGTTQSVAPGRSHAERGNEGPREGRCEAAIPFAALRKLILAEGGGVGWWVKAVRETR